MKYRILILLILMVSGIKMPMAQQLGKETSVQIYVAGVCGMCQERIESTALEIEGVKTAVYDIESHTLEVKITDAFFDLKALHNKIAAAGHTTNAVVADKAAYNALPFCCQYDHPENPHIAENIQTEVKAKPIAIRVAGVCGMCKERIEKVAMGTAGILSADWDEESQYLTIAFEKELFSEMGLHKNLADAGHETDLYEADQQAYDALPACCWYKDPANPHYAEKAANAEMSNNASGQQVTEIRGKVFERDEKGDQVPLIGANLFWLGKNSGTSTDLAGSYVLPMEGNESRLVVSYVGYKSDTITIGESLDSDIDIIMSNANDIEIVEIVHRKRTTELSMIDPIKVHKIGEKELMKAACCNLSESFETNPSIDVSFTDAVTGTRKIEMLGLAGKYVQITSESMPDIRGLSSINGLSYVPGPWIEGIQMNMGTGSVVNGYESITGQINVELRKPWESDPLYLNLFANMEGRMEANANVSHVFNKTWSTGILLHASKIAKVSDHNDDGFLDMPLGDQIIAMNRWKFIGKNGVMSQIAVKTTLVDKTSGQVAFYDAAKDGAYWGATQKTNRTEAWFKVGKIFPEKPYASIGFQILGVNHNQEFKFGNKPYDGLQQSLFANLIYQSIFTTSAHQYRTGLSFNMDKIDETISDQSFERNEMVPGAFFEYTYKHEDKFSLVAGLRGDYHNNYGFFATPRMNMKYSITDKTVIRVAAGRGQRTASIFSENIGFFASSRKFVLHSQNNSNPYGLEQEVAWNYGMNFTQLFNVFGSEAVFAIDAYHTRFENQIVVDLEKTGEIAFYNLDGKSYSNSIQAQLDFTVVKNFDIRMAYRFNDAKTSYDGELLQKALSAKHRAFINFAYATENKWKFDLTLNWQGQKRIPDTSLNPEAYRLEAYSPDFYLMNAQISKGWNDNIELYVGGENLLNFTQENPIISAADPFGSHFDSSLIWGPVFGQNLYAGLRYRIK